MPLENITAIPITNYYGLNLKESPGRLPIGFSREIHDIDLSDPGVAKTRKGRKKLNSYVPPFGAGALELTGSGLLSYISIADHSDFDFSGGTWTINCCFEVRSLATAGCIFSQITDANNYKLCRVNTDGSLEYKVVSGGATVVQLTSSASAVSVFTVYQLEIVESGNNWYMFLGLPTDVNMTLVDSDTDTSREANYTGAFEIGRVNLAAGYNYFVGRIDEFRVSNSARHTAVFAPYSAAFTDDANTKLLLHFNDDDQATSTTDSEATPKTVTFNGGARIHAGDLQFDPIRLVEWHIASKNKRKIAIQGDDGHLVIMEHSGRWKTFNEFSLTGRIMDFVGLEDKLFMSDGLNTPSLIDGATDTFRKWGIDYPVSKCAGSPGAVGVLTGTYQYVYTYYNSTSQHESSASPVSSEIEVTARKIELGDLLASSDSQVDKKRIYRTTNGGSTYFFLDEIDNDTLVYVDNATDSELDTREAPIENDPPPKFVGMEEWDGRIWGFVENGTVLKFSNDEFLTPAGSGLPEESFSADNEIDFKATIYAIKKSPNFNELWVHTSKGLYYVKASGVAEDPYYPGIRNSSWYSISHFSVTNILNDQWFIGSNGKCISLDSAGSVNYESYNIEPELALGNVGRYKYIQGGHYRLGTKNQFIFAYQQSGQVDFNRVACANYLLRTPTDDFGFTYPVWEIHNISCLSLGVVKDNTELDVLLTGHSDGYIRKHDIGTNDDGVAIDWKFDIGWMRSQLNISDTLLARKVIHNFYPHGSHSFDFTVEHDFGKNVRTATTISASPSGAQFNSAVFDTDVFADIYDLVRVPKDLGGHYNYTRLIYSSSTIDEPMELHNLEIQPIKIEGDRR